MDNAELLQVTARLRRTFPRQADVLTVCDEIERLVRDSIALQSRPVVSLQQAAATRLNGPKRDRAAYMRAYRARKA